jgi:hypothetical protein
MYQQCINALSFVVHKHKICMTAMETCLGGSLCNYMTMNCRRLKYPCLLTSNFMPHGNYDNVHASGKDAK